MYSPIVIGYGAQLSQCDQPPDNVGFSFDLYQGTTVLGHYGGCVNYPTLGSLIHPDPSQPLSFSIVVEQPSPAWLICVFETTSRAPGQDPGPVGSPPPDCNNQWAHL